MAYKVLISVGKGKNKSTMGSIALPNKQRVAEYVKRNPLGNYNTQIQVRDLRKKKTLTGSKLHFRTASNW